LRIKEQETRLTLHEHDDDDDDDDDDDTLVANEGSISIYGSGSSSEFYISLAGQFDD
jgi:hypothetical protein